MNLTSEEKLEVRKLRRHGWSYMKISRWIGCSKTAARYHADPDFRKRRAEYDAIHYQRNKHKHNERDRRNYHRRKAELVAINSKPNHERNLANGQQQNQI